MTLRKLVGHVQDKVSAVIVGQDPIPYGEMRASVESGGIIATAAREALIEQEIALWPEIMPMLEARKSRRLAQRAS